MTTQTTFPAPAETRTEAAPFPGMKWIPGGTFLMGSDNHYPEEAPAVNIKVDGFWMDTLAVTNADFKKFVEETGYVTFAERPLNPDDYPGALPDMLVSGSLVFKKTKGPVDLRFIANWWHYVPGASWKHPQGPGSSNEDIMDHPVVHVVWEDVEAYAKWIGKELPTEAEWEFAARGGLEGKEFVWGDEYAPGGKMMANTWQGEFPWQNLAKDGFIGTAPVGSYEPNGYGLHDMTGNVWEWTQDWFTVRDPNLKVKSCCIPENPRGGTMAQSIDSRQQIKIPRKVIKGGSHLCANNYCRRYRPAARSAQMIDSSTCHIGFRCIVRPGTDTRVPN